MWGWPWPSGAARSPDARGRRAAAAADCGVVRAQEQVEAWQPITKAVHDKGATFFCQARRSWEHASLHHGCAPARLLWHVGRASHPHYQPNEELPVSSSAIAVGNGSQCFSLKSMQLEDYPAPRALEKEEIPGIVEEFRVAARNAIAAGFDGVEVHGANGYLIDQDNVNHRTDEYGGPIENRCRFALEVVRAVVEEVGADRVGLRLSPFGSFLSATDSHPYALTTYLLEELNEFNLAYVHLVEPRTGGSVDVDPGAYSLDPFRKVYRGTVIAAGGYKRDDAATAVASGRADLVAFGRWFLANPDLPRRFQLGAPLNKYDRNTFYTQGEEGYVDYPVLEDTEEGCAFLAGLAKAQA
eukprot:scaffold4.g5008.t1